MVMVREIKKKKKKKCSVNDTMSVNVMHYLKKTRAMLPVAFEEFRVVYMFKLLFFSL